MECMFIKRIVLFTVLLASNFLNCNLAVGQVASVTSNLSDSVVVSANSSFPLEPIGATTVIGSENFNGGLIISTEELVLGKIPGVRITSNSGKPGSSFSIQNRGDNSFYGSSDLLIVLDNVPLYDAEININPNDIEKIEVYKDGWAVALFGERASSGAIVITTKKGGSAFKATYSGKFSVSSLPKQIDVFSGDEFRKLIYERYDDDHNAISLLGNENTNWQNEIYHTAIGKDHHIGIFGSVKTIPLRLSLGRTDQDGILKTSEYKRTTVSISADPLFFGNHLKVSVNLKGVFNRNRIANENAIFSAVRYNPTLPVYNSNGTYTQGSILAPINPIALLNFIDNKLETDRYLGNVQVDYKLHFFPDLRLILNYGEEYTHAGNCSISDTSAYWVSNGSGKIECVDKTTKNKTIDFGVNYSKQIESISSHLNLTVGISKQSQWIGIDYSSLIVVPNVSNSESNSNTKSQQSAYLRAGYAFKDRYKINFALRKEDNSIFAEKNRANVSYIAAISWDAKKEVFFSRFNVISSCNLRLGYAVTGDNSQLDASSSMLISPDLDHQEVSTFSGGIDYGLFNNRVYGSVDLYSKTGHNLYVRVPIPNGYSYFSSVILNGGRIENKGVEFNLNAKIISTKDWGWAIGFNAAFNKNKIVSLLKTDDEAIFGFPAGNIYGGYGGNIFMQSKGYPINSFFVLQQVYDQNGNPIEGAYVDRSGNANLYPEDYYHNKKAAPDWILGISSKLNYCSWDFAFSGRLSLGNNVYNNVSSNSFYDNLYDRGNFGTIGSLYNIPKLVNDTKFNSRQLYSDYYVENASFFRMDYISLGYSFTNLWKEKLGIRLSATVQNAFVITKYKGLDPEVATGIDVYSYPRARTISFGVNMEF